MAKKPLTTLEVKKRLAAKYTSWEYVYLEELRSSNGFARKVRSADAIAINLYPSHGCEMHGFEIKVSRSDFLLELKDPDKSDIFKQYCDRWFLVVGDASIVKPGELPAGWGLIIPRGDSLMVKIGANKLEPKPMGRGMYTAIMKRLKGNSLGDDERNRMQKEAEVEANKTAQVQIDCLTKGLENANEVIANFEKVTGERLQSWDHNKKAEGYKEFLAMNGQKQSCIAEARRRIMVTKNLLDTMEKYVEAMEPEQKTGEAKI